MQTYIHNINNITYVCSGLISFLLWFQKTFKQPVFRKAKPKKKKPGEAQHAEKEDISAVSSKDTCQDNLNTDEISDEVRNIEDIINIHIDPEQLDPLRRDNSSECSED
ncbi:Hypothetical_protein [Hexamita inflata]|uniref:Hypothetical_protein n=1 Tax=Hexamita inflata TaxID=28002 RepID=A0AA86PM37_9EUKA|nr:Hypothetical protein HINF_LOCUS25600 [Hexamita inflata]